ncbi:MAG: NAD(P)/FAD-dependent oxidoreductase [Desulfobacterales bacterium]|nr:NAD(P)/FAD-dependent oxidoreductase [Desulfobacterales bacterium]
MPEQKKVDVVILGVGPAGLQAAIHAARKKVSVLLMGRSVKSSLFHAHIENFCCIFKVSGEDMLQAGKEQALGFGAELLEEDVLKIAFAGNRFQIQTESGDRIESKSIVIATGTSRNKLGVPGEEKLLGRGVSYCVECDANFFKGEDVCVVGGESAAAGGALTLVHSSKSVRLVCRSLGVTAALKQELKQSPVIIHEGTWPVEIIGKDKVEGLKTDDGTVLSVSGIFVELGAKGVMELATSLGIQLDQEMRYIATNKQQETNVPGIFAAGDACGPPWQMAKAVGEGCVAGLGAATYVRKIPNAA